MKEDEDAALAYQEELTTKIDEKEQQIDQARETIQEMNLQIDGLEKKLSLAEEKYQETIQLFRERLRALYISGASSIGTLEILLSSSSFTDFFRKQKLTQVMAEHDQELLDKLNEYAQVTQGDRDALVEAQKAGGGLSKGH